MSSSEPPDDGEEVPIALLPAPLLQSILRLSTKDGAEFLRLAAVCRAWRDVVFSGQSWPHVHTLRLCAPGGLGALQLAPNLESLSVTALGGVGLGLELTLQAPPSLRRLELGVTRLAPTVLLALCSPALEVLDLRGSRVDGRTLAEVLKRCSALRQLSCDRLSCDLSRLTGRSLTHLRLGGTCTGLDAVALGAIAIGSPGLQVLEVDGSFLTCIPVAVLELEHLHSLHVDSANLRDESLIAEFDAARPAFPSLTMLSIPSCRSTGSGFRALAAALSNPDAPPLKRLIASNLLDLTDEDGATLLQAVRERGGAGGSCEARLALDVSCCGRLGARFFAECSKLHFLEFCASGLPLLTAEALSQIAASGALSHTSTLVLNDCELLQLRRGGDSASRVLKAAACAAGRSLEQLLLNDCALDDEAARAIAGACPSLLTLSLVAVSNLSDAGMLSLATHCGAT